jgi:hypothetical protein
MIYIRVEGGLGNQIFYMALSMVLESYGHEVYFDISYYSKIKNLLKVILLKASFNTLKNKIFLRKFMLKDVFNLQLKTINNPNTNGLIYINEYEVLDGKIHLSKLSKTVNYYLIGTWANVADLNMEEFRHFFNFSKLGKKNIDTLSLITNTESVGIHVRRTDFLVNPENVLNMDYYFNSLNYLQNLLKKKKLKFFVFSDDSSFVKKNLILKDVTYVDWNTMSPDLDFHLLSKCKHNIIANSTFSWWAANINPNKNKIVLAPSRWSKVKLFKDSTLFMSDWILIDD